MDRSTNDDEVTFGAFGALFSGPYEGPQLCTRFQTYFTDDNSSNVY
jgi:hypothetical protein